MAHRTIESSGDAFTYADVEAVPDDGSRYELSYGTLIVTPAPNTRRAVIAHDAELEVSQPFGMTIRPAEMFP